MDRPPFLEPYKGPSSRYTCPKCERRRKFTRYVDAQTGEHIADHVGKCDRADKCGYHYPPRDYFRDNGIRPSRSHGDTGHTPAPAPPPRPPYLHDRAEVKALRAHRERNTLSAYWRDHMDAVAGAGRWDAVCYDYALGTWPDGPMAGAAVYWQVNTNGRVKGGKVMLYDPSTGKRRKDVRSTSWVHSLKGGISEGFRLEQCLFGEHLLKNWPMDKPVAVVESEKTAMIAAALMPNIRWVAVGSVGEFKKEKLKPLFGRKVLAFPDLSKDGSAYWGWKERADELRPFFFSIHVSDYLEAGATLEAMEAGLDIGDFLLREAAPPPKVSNVSLVPVEQESFLAASSSSTPEAVAAPPPTPAPRLPAAILSEAEVVVKRWAEKNPAVNTLVEELGLDLSAAKVRRLPSEA